MKPKSSPEFSARVSALTRRREHDGRVVVGIGQEAMLAERGEFVLAEVGGVVKQELLAFRGHVRRRLALDGGIAPQSGAGRPQ